MHIKRVKGRSAMWKRSDENKYVNLAGDYFHVRCMGEGDSIICLHGGPGSDHHIFLPHVLPLAQDFKLILYDQRGCGKSEQAPKDVYSMMDEVNNLELLRKELRLEKINLFGESWGSMLALLYAVTYPKHVNKILLTAAIGVSKDGFIAFGKELEKRLSKEDKETLSRLEQSLTINDKVIREILNVLDPYYVFSKKALRHKKHTSMNQEVNTCIGNDILKNYDLTEKLYVLSNIPILVAQGSHDLLTPSLIDELLISHIPHAQLIEIKNCGHWTVVEKPKEMVSIAYKFFSS